MNRSQIKNMISIVVPVYNVEEFLPKCLESIIAQTYINIEIILVDDGSTDSSPIICDKYALKDSRIMVIHKSNGGLSDARNTGMAAAHGEYIAFIDSDDYIAPHMLETMLNRIQKDNSDMALCDFLYVDMNNVPIDWQNKNSQIKDGLLTRNETLLNIGRYYVKYVVVWNKLYKLDLIRDVLFPIGKIHEDEFTTYKFINRCNTVSCIADPMYFYVQRNNSIMHSKYSIKRLDRTEAMFNRIEFALANDLSELAVADLTRTCYSLAAWSLPTHRNNPAISLRLKNLKKTYDSLFFRVCKNCSIKKKVLFATCYISPRILHYILQTITCIRKYKVIK